jgi:hypothetical protein
VFFEKVKYMNITEVKLLSEVEIGFADIAFKFFEKQFEIEWFKEFEQFKSDNEMLVYLKQFTDEDADNYDEEKSNIYYNLLTKLHLDFIKQKDEKSLIDYLHRVTLLFDKFDRLAAELNEQTNGKPVVN